MKKWESIVSFCTAFELGLISNKIPSSAWKEHGPDVGVALIYVPMLFRSAWRHLRMNSRVTPSAPLRVAANQSPSGGNYFGRISKRPIVEVQVLESRQLFSADLAGAFVGKIPAALTVQGTNKVTIRLSNAGAAAAGPVTVALYASLDATLDSSDVALMPTV